MFGRLPLRKYFLPDVLRTAEEVGGHRALKCRWQLALEWFEALEEPLVGTAPLETYPKLSGSSLVRQPASVQA